MSYSVEKRGTREGTGEHVEAAEVSVCSQRGCPLISPHSWKCHSATERSTPTEKATAPEIPAFSGSKVTKFAAQSRYGHQENTPPVFFGVSLTLRKLKRSRAAFQSEQQSNAATHTHAQSVASLTVGFLETADENLD